MRIVFVLCLAFFLIAISVAESGATSQRPQVTMETSVGRIVLELYPDKAPKTVANFLGYAKSGHYNGTIFHRVIPKFMIQGGGFTLDMKQKPSGRPIGNEADNGLKNTRGTIAMARTQDPHSATSQFFINTVDNDYLNHKSKDVSGWGYTVFGRVIEGMVVVDSISEVKTGTKGMFRNVPVEPIVIDKMSVRE
jgi:cyclophilin family peptidyl-prolyl cis-trans isomerase